jgi:AmiR/NasT family two-component response regulator
LINQQLQTALNTRVTIEQAKGVLAERGNVDMDQAFVLLRSYARRTQQRLADVALAVVEKADTSAILDSDPM